MENNYKRNLLEKEEKQASYSQNPSKVPSGLPEKFWDAQREEIKLQEFIEDYNSLAARDTNLVETNNRNIPESYDKYDLKVPHPFLERDDDVYKKFYEYGFSNDQAQLVYDLANERVIPYLDDMASQFESQKQIDKLTSYFGGEEKFNEASRQISNWAKQNMQAEVYDALARTSEGVVALYKMMSSNEPAISKEKGFDENLSEETLKKMVQDPRYWREKDKQYISQVTKGFDKLYPERNN